MATTTSTAARCVGESARRGAWGGTHSLGRCARPVAFVLLGHGDRGRSISPVLTCQPHLGGLVARLATQRGSSGTVTVLTATPEGMCARCGERPGWHEPGAACPATL
jgi:hypothetical protein